MNEPIAQRQFGGPIGGAIDDYLTVATQTTGIKASIGSQVDLQHPVNTDPASDLLNAITYRSLLVIDHRRCPRRNRLSRFFIRGHRCDDRGPGLGCHLASVVSHGPGPAGYEYIKTAWVTAERDRTVRRQCGYPRQAPTSNEALFGKRTACLDGSATYSAAVP